MKLTRKKNDHTQLFDQLAEEVEIPPLVNSRNILLFREGFQKQWEKAIEHVRQRMMLFAAELPPVMAAGYLIRGLNDNQIKVQMTAKGALEKVTRRISTKDPVAETEHFTFILFQELHGNLTLNLRRLYLQLLLMIEGRGPLFAWRFFLTGIVPHQLTIDMLKAFPEAQRLQFVLQYSLDSVLIRSQFCSPIENLLKDIQNIDIVMNFFANLYDQALFLDPLLMKLSVRLRLQEHIITHCLKAEHTATKITALKVLGILDSLPGYLATLPLLQAIEPPTIRLTCLSILATPMLKKNTTIIKAVASLFNDPDPTIADAAFKTYLSLSPPDRLNRFKMLYTQSSQETALLFNPEILHFSHMEISHLMKQLPEERQKDFIKQTAQALLKDNPDWVMRLLNILKLSENDRIRYEADVLIKKNIALQKEVFQEIANTPPELPVLPHPSQKSFLSKLKGSKKDKFLKRINQQEQITDENLQGEVFADLDWSEINLQRINFEGAHLVNVDLSHARLADLNLSGATLNNVKLDGATFDALILENAVLVGCAFTNCDLRGADFAGATLFDCWFDTVNLQRSIFIGATITKTVFIKTDFSHASLAYAQLTIAQFDESYLMAADFYRINAQHCTFNYADKIHIKDLDTAVVMEHSPNLPELFTDSALYRNHSMMAYCFDQLLIRHEIDRQESHFRAYNRRRIELAIDALQYEQVDAFSLIPLLLHLPARLSAKGNQVSLTPAPDIPSGIFSYHPSEFQIQTLKKYFTLDSGLSLANDPLKKAYIEGLSIIGSIGTIAQSHDSDIDYWVCLESEKIGIAGMEAFKAKLVAIEEWVDQKMGLEIHFFIVNPKDVKEDRYGESDQESSGSAQGKILKEEFYRTMVHVAGKLILWTVIPPYIKGDDAFQKIKAICNSDGHYIDMGRIAQIPIGEYFGASIWQIFKSLKSPYKSVIKMGLLSKYVHLREKAHANLLCNKLKQRWAGGESRLIALDPYLLLLLEVQEYYIRTQKHKESALIQDCFFLKLGIRSIEDLDRSVFGIRKQLIKDLLVQWEGSQEKMVDLGNFRNWPFEKVLAQSIKINDYMIKTYNDMTAVLQRASKGTALITPEDRTILGRKMFAQFARQNDKVDKLFLVSHGKTLFQQLFFQCETDQKKRPIWFVAPVHVQFRSTHRATNEYLAQSHILYQSRHLEAVAIWLVYNGFYDSTPKFQLLPNPTPVMPQDILELLEKLHLFFPKKEIGIVSNKDLLRKPTIVRLFITANFGIERKLNRIHEYSVIYLTSWGELYCKIFQDRNGLNSMDEVLVGLEEKLDLPIVSYHVGGYIPSSARKRIRLGSKVKMP